ncbi:LytR/AlgR family response regulator transcription factor [Bacteroidota bacterium]
MSDKIKALIIDDERLARRKLISLLSNFERIEIIGEAENVDEAIIEIEDSSPDVLFLDIQMPGQSGFDLLNRIDYSGKIIFVTAFDEYAIRAFDVNALDYLLKPISPERLEKSVQKILSQENKEKVIKQELRYNDRLFVSLGNNHSFVSLSELILIKALGDYTRLIINGNKKSVILRSMKEWEKILPDNHFIRIHRSFIVNINFIEKINKSENHNLSISLKGVEKPLPISRSYRKKIRDKY